MWIFKYIMWFQSLFNFNKHILIKTSSIVWNRIHLSIHNTKSWISASHHETWYYHQHLKIIGVIYLRVHIFIYAYVGVCSYACMHIEGSSQCLIGVSHLALWIRVSHLLEVSRQERMPGEPHGDVCSILPGIPQWLNGKYIYTTMLAFSDGF